MSEPVQVNPIFDGIAQLLRQDVPDDDALLSQIYKLLVSYIKGIVVKKYSGECGVMFLNEIAHDVATNMVLRIQKGELTYLTPRYLGQYIHGVWVSRFGDVEDIQLEDYCCPSQRTWLQGEVRLPGVVWLGKVAEFFQLRQPELFKSVVVLSRVFQLNWLAKDFTSNDWLKLCGVCSRLLDCTEQQILDIAARQSFSRPGLELSMRFGLPGVIWWLVANKSLNACLDFIKMCGL